MREGVRKGPSSAFEPWSQPRRMTLGLGPRLLCSTCKRIGRSGETLLRISFPSASVSVLASQCRAADWCASTGGSFQLTCTALQLSLWRLLRLSSPSSHSLSNRCLPNQEAGVDYRGTVRYGDTVTLIGNQSYDTVSNSISPSLAPCV